MSNLSSGGRVSVAAAAFILLLVPALLSGCSKEGSVSFNSGGMTHTFSEGKDAVPKDFSLPVYPGATATGSVSAEGTGPGRIKIFDDVYE